jgi:hypothetical protein
MGLTSCRVSREKVEIKMLDGSFNFMFRYIDDVFSLNNPTFGDYADILLNKNSSTLRDLFVKWEWCFLYLGFTIMWHIGNTCLLLLLYPEQKTFWCRTDRYLIIHSTCMVIVQCNMISSWYNCKKLSIWTNDYQSTHSLYYCSIFIIYSCSIHTCNVP